MTPDGPWERINTDSISVPPFGDDLSLPATELSIRKEVVPVYFSACADPRSVNKDYAEKMVELYGGNRSRAADVLGISRMSLWRILKEEE